MKKFGWFAFGGKERVVYCWTVIIEDSALSTGFNRPKTPRENRPTSWASIWFERPKEFTVGMYDGYNPMTTKNNINHSMTLWNRFVKIIDQNATLSQEAKTLELIRARILGDKWAAYCWSSLLKKIT